MADRTRRRKMADRIQVIIAEAPRDAASAIPASGS